MKGFTRGDVARLRDWYRVRPGYWFAPKAYGLGAVPVTWQGWLLTAGFVLLALLIAGIAQQRSPAWLALLAPLTIGFVGLCWAKTDGGWRWRWGAEDRK
ncbi:MAG: hypothetical protein EOP61_09625 [Sphingomonadales bacterium]|nr:MAG: hypothetical protein EOP61_09625 [Sphingomonadales bacterium]